MSDGAVCLHLWLKCLKKEKASVEVELKFEVSPVGDGGMDQSEVLFQRNWSLGSLFHQPMPF